MSLKPLNDSVSSSTLELTQKIKAEAKRLGFFACGVAKADHVDRKSVV